MTIEERADDILREGEEIAMDDLYSRDEVKAMLIRIASEQKKIDIDKAWKWIEDNLFEKDTRNLDLWQRDFRKAMEE